MGVPVASLPACHPICHDYGQMKHADIPVKAVTGDQNAAFFSLGRMPAGASLVNLGTGAFVLSPAGGKAVYLSRLLTGIVASTAHQAEYVLEGTVNGAGAALDWAAEDLGIEHLYERLPRWLSKKTDVPVFINAVGGLGSPWWQAKAVSRWIGEGTSAQRAAAC